MTDKTPVEEAVSLGELRKDVERASLAFQVGKPIESHMAGLIGIGFNLLDRLSTAEARIRELEGALEEIDSGGIPDQPASQDVPELVWAQRHVGKLRLIARKALGGHS